MATPVVSTLQCYRARLSMRTSSCVDVRCTYARNIALVDNELLFGKNELLPFKS